jgi:amidase
MINQTGEPVIPSVTKLNLLTPGPALPMLHYFALNAKRHEIAKHYASEIWAKNELEAIIMPPAPYTAVPHDEWATATYTVIWNLLDYPAFLIPVGEVEEGDVVDENVKYGEGDEAVYKLCKFPRWGFRPFSAPHLAWGIEVSLSVLVWDNENS